MGNSKEAILSLINSEKPIEIHSVKIFHQVSETKIVQLNYTSRTKWEGDPRTFPWTFEKTETMYFVEGKVKVNVEGHEKDMKYVWNITKSVEKYYIHEEL